MKYPREYSLDSEPKEIRVGDLVWWNEGVCIGFVENLIEDERDREDNDMDESGIAFTNLHPFEANKLKHKQHIGFVSNGGTVIYPESVLEDEGIGLLTEYERSELNWAISTAKEAVSPEHRELPFCVTAVMNQNRREEDWVFHFVDRECQIIESVAFPFRPSTRNLRGESGPRE